MPAKVLAQAVSNDGKHLYVVVEPTTPATLRQLHVLDTTQPGMPDFNTNPLDLPNSTGSAVALAVAPNARLLALVASSGDVLRWPADLDTNPAPAAPDIVKNLGAGVAGLTLSSDGKLAFVLGPGNQIQALDLAAATVTPNHLPRRSLRHGAGQQHRADMLAVADQIICFFTVQLPPSAGDESVKLDHRRSGSCVIAGHGRCLHAGKRHRRLYSIGQPGALVQHLAATPGAAFKIGGDSRQIVMTTSGKRLYIPYVDDIAQPAAGGVAIVEVTEGSCAEILWRHLDGCPHCDLPDCVVLATIENYHLGDRIEEQTDPPADPAQDAQDKIVRIDNRRGRRLLPSTEVLTELVECLQSDLGELSSGSSRHAGREGDKGDKGDKGDSVTRPTSTGESGLGVEKALRIRR